MADAHWCETPEEFACAPFGGEDQGSVFEKIVADSKARKAAKVLRMLAEEMDDG